MSRPHLVNAFIRGDKLSGKMKNEVVAYLAQLETENNNLRWAIDNIDKIKTNKPKI